MSLRRGSSRRLPPGDGVGTPLRANEVANHEARWSGAGWGLPRLHQAYLEPAVKAGFHLCLMAFRHLEVKVSVASRNWNARLGGGRRWSGGARWSGGRRPSCMGDAGPKEQPVASHDLPLIRTVPDDAVCQLPEKSSASEEYVDATRKGDCPPTRVVEPHPYTISSPREVPLAQYRSAWAAGQTCRSRVSNLNDGWRITRNCRTKRARLALLKHRQRLTRGVAEDCLKVVKSGLVHALEGD